MKKLATASYILLIIVMASATVIEHMTDTATAHHYIYGSWWFIALWALLAFAGVVLLYQQLRPLNWRMGFSKARLWCLHTSLLIILAGALTTHLTSSKGLVHLRGDQPTRQYMPMDDEDTPNRQLPFSLRLEDFSIDYHEGTLAANDYTTHFVIMDGEKSLHAQVSMNKVFVYRGIRFYQTSYDSDNMGSWLTLNSDPYGIPLTYCGYGLLFLSLILMLIDKRGTFRRLLRNELPLRLGIVAIMMLTTLETRAVTTVSEPVANQFGSLLINYNDRICLMKTFALDFTQKLYGSHSYKKASAEQVVASWIFYPEQWEQEPIIKVKNRKLRNLLGLPAYASVHDFFHDGNYILGPLLQEYRQGAYDKTHEACADLDGKLQLVMSLRDGSLLRIFPYTSRESTVSSSTVWYSPVDSLPESVPKADQLFYRNLYPLLSTHIREQDDLTTIDYLSKTGAYQLKNGGSSLPSKLQIKAERLYDSLPITWPLAILCMIIGLIGIVIFMFSVMRGRTDVSHAFKILQCIVMSGVFLMLTLLLMLRWIISGNIPLNNGYETLLSAAWATLLLSELWLLLRQRTAFLITTFSLLACGFFLMVSHLSIMDPAIGPRMPVLNSPLLSIHVSIIMLSYALLAITFLCGITTLIVDKLRKDAHETVRELTRLSLLCLYPAIATLAMGIFMGAVWANVSWGSYWSWDPKETWALITLLVYAVPAHTSIFHRFCQPRFYHTYIVVAFLTILITFFGVNFLLAGMHSYA